MTGGKGNQWTDSLGVRPGSSQEMEGRTRSGVPERDLSYMENVAASLVFVFPCFPILGDQDPGMERSLWLSAGILRELRVQSRNTVEFPALKPADGKHCGLDGLDYTPVWPEGRPEVQ